MFCFPICAFSEVQYQNEETSNIILYEKVNPAIVSIEANIQDGQSIGTGFVIDSSGVILTSQHVLENAKKVQQTNDDKASSNKVDPDGKNPEKRNSGKKNGNNTYKNPNRNGQNNNSSGFSNFSNTNKEYVGTIIDITR